MAPVRGGPRLRDTTGASRGRTLGVASGGAPALRGRLDQPAEVLRVEGFNFGVWEVLAEHRDELSGLGQRGRPDGSALNLEGLVLDESREGLGRSGRGYWTSPSGWKSARREVG